MAAGGAPRRAGRTVWPRNAYGPGRPNGCGADGRRRRSAGVCVWSIPETGRCTAIRRPCADESMPTGRDGSGGPAPCRRAIAVGARRGAGAWPASAYRGRTPVRERPRGPSDRSRFGEWEADGVIGVSGDPHAEVERRTRFLMARIAPDKTADASVETRIAMFRAQIAGARTTRHGHVSRRPVQRRAGYHGRDQQPSHAGCSAIAHWPRHSPTNC